MATKVASVFAEIGGDATGLQNAIKGAMGNLKDLADAFKKLTGVSAKSAMVAAGVGVAIYEVGNFLAQTVSEAQAYNMTMVDLAQKMGTTTEEASKLVQVADDVRISQEQIATAMTYAIRNGVDPSIEGLAKLADQYTSIADPVARGQLLLNNFGRAGMEMGRLLELGGEGIRNASEAINDNLIVTEEAAKASQKYFVAVDNLNDAWMGYKMNIGNQIIPGLVQLLDVTNANAEATIMLGNAGIKASPGMIRHWANLILVARASAIGVDETGFLKNAMEATIPTVEDLTGEAGALSNAMHGVAANTGNAINQITKLSELNVGGLLGQIGGLSEQQDFAKVGGVALTETYKKVEALSDAAARYGTGLEVAAGLTYDLGVATAQAMVKSGKSIDEVSQQFSDSFGTSVADAKKAIQGMPVDLAKLNGRAEFWLDIWIVTHGGGDVGSIGNFNFNWTGNNTMSTQGGIQTARATGGEFTVPPGYPTDSFPILAKTGERVSVTAAGQPQEGMGELLAAIRTMPNQIARAVRDAVLTA